MVVNMVKRNPAWALRLVQKLGVVQRGKKTQAEVGEQESEGCRRGQEGRVGTGIWEDVSKSGVEHGGISSQHLVDYAIFLLSICLAA